MDSILREIVALDRRLFRVVFRAKWPPLTSVLRGFTVVGTAGSLWGVLAAGGFVAGGLLRPAHLVVPWGSVAASWTIAEGTKYLFDRTRPFIHDKEILPLIKTPSSSSFPSGHSATAAAGALTLSAIYPAFAPALLLAGFLVALSRVYLGVHYPFDVFAGALIGLVVAIAFLEAADTLA